MNLWNAVTYPFHDKRWTQKIGTSLLMAAIPLMGYFLIKGYEYEISVWVWRGQQGPMPDWRKPFSRLGRGLAVRGAGWLYNIPTVVLFGLGLALWINVGIRFFTDGPLTPARLGVMLSDHAPLRFTLLGLTVLYAVAGNILYWSGYLRYIKTQDYLDFFDIIDNIRLVFVNIWDDLIMSVYQAVLGILLFILGALMSALFGSTGVGVVLIPLLVPAVTLTIASLFSGYLYGQLAINTLGPPDAPRQSVADLIDTHFADDTTHD